MAEVNANDSADPGRGSFIIDPNETVLVTGANGYVGSAVVRTLLSYGFKRIRCLTRSTSNSKTIDSIA
jgi:FlaA1/EpsC-like NDP-sugar epimerase